MPVSVVVGERDDKFRRIGAQMASGIPEAGVEIVPGAAHAVHLEAPSHVAETIRGRV
jgi:2-succinyl-5-enolpyruvyl-6-hydroxy-3-cyclohexene-1-carboxylate synthase/2-succinyl-6-hydroxy-2,4-cyclohexadiene-1-carboxylate synthase